MGATITRAIVRDELEKMKAALDQGNLQDVIDQSRKEMYLLENTTLNIAVTGVSGAGKSSFVNAIRGMTDDEEDSAKTDVVQGTMEPKAYSHPMLPKVTLWDLPGVGTSEFKADSYLKKVNYSRYDFFIIVVAESFTENEVKLAREIQKNKKKFYYVRTKVDVSIDSERRKSHFNEWETLHKIRRYCCEELKKAGESSPKVFLMSRWDLNMYDFPDLQETLEADLDDLKERVLIMAMPAFSQEMLKKKKVAMQELIWKQAFISCALGAIPVPGLSFFCDVAILVGTLSYFCRVFGLDEECLSRLSKQVGKPVPVLKSAIKKSPMACEITKEFVIDLLAKSAVCGGLMALELALNFVPVLGSIAGGSLSFITTYYMLNSFLNDVVEDAKNLLAKASEPYDSQAGASLGGCTLQSAPRKSCAAAAATHWGLLEQKACGFPRTGMPCSPPAPAQALGSTPDRELALWGLTVQGGPECPGGPGRERPAPGREGGGSGQPGESRRAIRRQRNTRLPCPADPALLQCHVEAAVVAAPCSELAREPPRQASRALAWGAASDEAVCRRRVSGSSPSMPLAAPAMSGRGPSHSDVTGAARHAGNRTR